MYGRELSPEFLAQQIRDKWGSNNHQFGVIKSKETITKLTKLVYVYQADTKNLIGKYSTIECKKEFKIGYNTIKKYIENKKAYKGILSSYNEIR